MSDHLQIGNERISNRFFLGTGKFKSKEEMKRIIAENQIDVVTVAMRRVDPEGTPENILDFIPEGTILMMNTSGARTASEAVEIARLAKEAAGISWIKVEVINDTKYLMPDNAETVKATEILASEGFTVLPYMSPDLYIARDLVKAGAAAVMPLGSFIGSLQGLQTKKLIAMLIREIDIPVIVDAGIGQPSHATEAMEIGADAVLANTAISTAGNPFMAATAFSLAVKAGRMGFLGKLEGEKESASPSSPLTGFLFNDSK